MPTDRVLHKVFFHGSRVATYEFSVSTLTLAPAVSCVDHQTQPKLPAPSPVFFTLLLASRMSPASEKQESDGNRPSRIDDDH